MQVIYGPRVSVIKSDLEEYLHHPSAIQPLASVEIKEPKEEEHELIQAVFTSPINGEAKLINETPDATFAQKMMGDGIVIFPHDGNLYAPCDGKIQFVFDTKHAIGFISEEGVELLIHVGINTVDLKGQGFHVLVENGQTVKKGTKLMEFDLQYIREQASSDAVPLVFTNLGTHH